MLRRVGARGLSAIGNRLTFPLMMVATVFLLVLPMVDERRIYISENNLKPYAAPMVTMSDLSTPNPFGDVLLREQGRVMETNDGAATYAGGRRRKEVSVGDAVVAVRGQRSTGGCLMSILVNRDEPVSVEIAGALFTAFQRRRATILSGDLEFRFFSQKKNNTTTSSLRAFPESRESRERYPTLEEAARRVPSEVEVAVVLDIADVTADAGSLCFNVFGSDGVQPNMDIVNLMTMLGLRNGIEWDFLCQCPVSSSKRWLERFSSTVRAMFSSLGATPVPQHATLVRLGHYVLSLVTASTTGAAPADGGASLRMRGMHPIVLSSHKSSKVAGHRFKQADASMPVISAIEGLVRGVNNLDERLHHSFPVYLHVSAQTFVDFEVAQHIIFVVLGAIASDVFLSFQMMQKSSRAGDDDPEEEWSTIFGSHVMRAAGKLLLLLVVSFVTVCQSSGASLLGGGAGGVFNGASAFLLELLPDGWMASVPGLDTQKLPLTSSGLPLVVILCGITGRVLSTTFARSSSSSSVASHDVKEPPQGAAEDIARARRSFSRQRAAGAANFVIGIWNCVVLCLVLAYHPLLGLLGSLCLGWLHGWTSWARRQGVQEDGVLTPTGATSLRRTAAAVVRRMVGNIITVVVVLCAYAGAEFMVANNLSKKPNNDDTDGGAGSLHATLMRDTNSCFALFGILVNIWWFVLHHAF